MITRPIDDTGRVCIPMEFRKALGMDKHGALAMELRGNQIIIEKSHDICCVCAGDRDLEELGKRKICKSCMNELIGAAALERYMQDMASGKKT